MVGTKKHKAPTQWIKNHPLEGDGLITGFYNFLYKRNTKTMKACKGVLIPDTIVFDHNFPRGWYTSDLKTKEISKRQGKELDASSIYQGFSKSPDPNVGIVASYLCSFEEEDASGATHTVTEVEFFNEESLKEFVGRKSKKEGILQKFLIPKGHRNSVIQAVWSPKVCLVQRRTNCGSIRDKLQCERDPYVCAVTYEGPSHYSEEGTCAGHTTEEVKDICGNIVAHFHATEHKTITRMVLYFKVDENDQVWLLFCGSLRVADHDQPSGMPLELAPRFSVPQKSENQQSPKRDRDDEALLEADQRFYAITSDSMFYSRYVKPELDTASDREQNEDGSSGQQQQSQSQQSQQQSTSAKRQEQEKKKADNGRSAKDDNDEDWHKLPGIQDQYRELCLDRDMVLSFFDDIFYEAYGHFLRHEPGPFNFEVDRKVAQTLGVEVLQELMQSVKIEHVISSDEAGPSIDDEELCFTISPHQHQGPVTKLGEAVARWIRAHYLKREKELREEAAVPASNTANEEEPQQAENRDPDADAEDEN